MLSIDVQIERYADSDRLARYYGIGQYRYIPGRKKVSNAARIGIVKLGRQKQFKIKKEKVKRGQRNVAIGDLSKLKSIM